METLLTTEVNPIVSTVVIAGMLYAGMMYLRWSFARQARIRKEGR